MSVDELSVMDGSKCVLQLRGVRPFLSDKYDITKHKNYRFLSDANPKNAFDIGKFVSKRLKVDPDEDYLLVEYTPTDDEMPEEALGDYQSSDEAVEESDDFEDFPEDLEIV